MASPRTIEFSDAVAAFPNLRGHDGAGTALRISAGFVQWTRDDQAAWANLIAVSDLEGLDGRSVELATSGTALQTRQSGGNWVTIFDLATLRSRDGTDGREVALQVVGTMLQSRLGTGGWANLFDFSAVRGPAGPGTALRISGGLIQWKRDDQDAWANLISVAELRGSAGASAELRTSGTTLQTRQSGGDWLTIFDLAALRPRDGTDGRDVSLQVVGTVLQWRLGSGEWANLYDLSTLKRLLGLDDVLARFARINAGLYPSERPGDNPSAFTALNAGGDPEAMAPLDLTVYPVRAVADGRGVEVSASREVWERSLHAVEASRLWRARWRFVRTANTPDAAGDSIALLLQWKDRDRKNVGPPVVVRSPNPITTDGPFEFSTFIGVEGVAGVDPLCVRPSNAIYMSIGIRAYGVEPKSVLTDLSATDVSGIRDAILLLVPEDSIPALGARIDELAGSVADADETISNAIIEGNRILAERIVTVQEQNALTEAFKTAAQTAIGVNTESIGELGRQVTANNTTQFEDTNKVAGRATTLEARTKGQGFRYRAINARPHIQAREVYTDASGGYAIYTFATRTNRDIPSLGALTTFPADFNGAVVLYLNAYIRKNEDSALQAGQDPTDTLLITNSYLLTPNSAGVNLIPGSVDLVGSPTQKFYWQAVKLDLGGVGPIPADTMLVFRVEAIGGDGVTRVPIGWAKGAQTIAAEKAIYKGLRAKPAAPNAAVALASNTDTLPFVLSERWTMPAFGGDCPPPLCPVPTSTAAGRQIWTDNTIVLPEIVIERAGASLVIPSQPLSFALPKQEAVTQRLMLQYGYSWNLYHQDVSNVSMTRVSNGAPLDLGPDYYLDLDDGAITGMKDVPPFQVDVTYTADFQRYDIVYADPNVGGAAIRAGTDRGGDVNEYQPKAPLGGIPLFRALVSRSRGTELIPLYNWSGFALRGEEALHMEWLEYCRKATAKVWRQVQSGSLRVCGYGHSITAQGTGYPSDDNPNAFYVPNGSSRDNRDYVLTNRYPIATLDTIAPLTGGHTRIGSNWAFMRAITAASGVVPEYVNLGIGGTHAGNTIRNGVPDGTYPARLEAVVACKPHVAILDFGMGMVGLDIAYSSTTSMIAYLDSYGIETVVMGLQLPNKRGFRTAPLDSFRRTNDDLAQAARDMGKAFIPLHRWCDPRNPGAFGFSYATASGANCLNHPGPSELAAYGAMLAQIVPPALGGLRGILRLPGDPTSSDIPLNAIRDCKNLATGRISTWVNDDGTMVDLLKLSTN